MEDNWLAGGYLYTHQFRTGLDPHHCTPFITFPIVNHKRKPYEFVFIVHHISVLFTTIVFIVHH